jgi:hypothetical protein
MIFLELKPKPSGEYVIRYTNSQVIEELEVSAFVATLVLAAQRQARNQIRAQIARILALEKES